MISQVDPAIDTPLIFGQHPENNRYMAVTGSMRTLIDWRAEAEDVAVLAQSQLDDNRGDKSSERTTSQHIVETLNILVNDGVNARASTPDLIASSELNFIITPLPMLEHKGFFRICVVAKSSRSAYSSRRQRTSPIFGQQWSLPRMNEFSESH